MSALASSCYDAGLQLIPTIDEIALLAPLPAFWETFTASDEYADGLADPLDRYSKRIIGGIAHAFRLDAVFPSDGPPYPPFISWAIKAGSVHQSPIGLLVHNELGLWISFRGALIGHHAASAEHFSPKHFSPGHFSPGHLSPCLACGAPCETACPVNAFDGGQYDVDACRAYLRSGDVDCWKGCLARRACPAAKIPREPAQSRFHMKAFCTK